METERAQKNWRILRRSLIGVAILATLIAIFYTEEDWRGKRAWENCKRELEAKGAVLDWDKFIPATVPDDQNFFKAPGMANWFVTHHTVGSLAFTAEYKMNELGQHLDPKYPFDVASRNGSNSPVVIAGLFFTSPVSVETGLRFGDPAAGTQIRNLVKDVIGQSANGAQGLTLSAKTLSQIKPEQIRVLASSIPSSDEVVAFLNVTDVATNLGPVRIETGIDNKSFRVLLVPRPSISAADYLAWSDRAEGDFNLIREALKRPYARMDGDYTRPFEIPTPNFVMTRALAQTLDQRTKCYLLLGQPEKALNELTLLNDSRRLLEGAPTGEPMTLVAAMINVAITGLYVNTIADGFQRQAWQEPQLIVLQEQLAGINLVPSVVQAFAAKPAAECRTLETTSIRNFMFMPYAPAGGRSAWQKIRDLRFHTFDLVPQGWIYQNMATVARLDARQFDGFDAENGTILPDKVEDWKNEAEKFKSHLSPYTFVAVIGLPDLTRAVQILAYNQTLVNEGRIVCALERYHLAHGEYPETLDALVPQFIEKLPHDIISGPPSQGSGATSQPLHYRRTDNGKFLLYSIGWNETDDGGQISEDRKIGDWVWKN